MTHLFGKPMSYWLELETRVPEQVNVEGLINEIVTLRGKVSFYEARIKEMHSILTGEYK